ncbi:MAG: hypothetical protein AB1330_01480 [Bacillota bacterium]
MKIANPREKFGQMGRYYSKSWAENLMSLPTERVRERIFSADVSFMELAVLLSSPHCPPEAVQYYFEYYSAFSEYEHFSEYVWIIYMSILDSPYCTDEMLVHMALCNDEVVSGRAIQKLKEGGARA